MTLKPTLTYLVMSCAVGTSRKRYFDGAVGVYWAATSATLPTVSRTKSWPCLTAECSCLRNRSR
jgi:hypothetical protein